MGTIAMNRFKIRSLSRLVFAIASHGLHPKPAIGWMLLLVFTISAKAQTNHSGNGQWAKYIATTPAGRVAIINPQPDSYYLWQSGKPVKKEDLWRAGVQLIRQLDNRHYIVQIKGGMPSALSNKAGQWWPANYRWKLSPGLESQLENNKASNTPTHFAVTVSDTSGLRKQLSEKASGLVTIVSSYPATLVYIIECSRQTLFEKILPLPAIIYAEEAELTPHEEGLLFNADLSVNSINRVHHQHPTLTGAGITLSVKELGYNTSDLDLQGRHVTTALEAANTSEHATTMATLIAGAANLSPKSRGVLPDSRLASSDYANLFPDDDAYFTRHGITVQNHSYGTFPQNFYGAQALAYDAHTYQQSQLLHVFSVGNQGNATDSLGPYRQVSKVANLTGNFKMAKNILTVGSIDTAKRLDQNVSRGPAYDGRIKPELVAYSLDGSSSAAALVSGAGGLLQQAYKEQHNGSLPPAALLKSILINSADEVGAPGPDYQSGYGNLNVHRALATLRDGRYFEGSLRRGEKISWTINLTAGVHHFKATLIWHDPAAQANAAYALVNDLDMTVEEVASENRYRPWVLNPYPHPDSLAQLPVRKPDHLNNSEQISIDQPRPGAYTITVSAFDLPVSPQSCYIAYYWEEADAFTWTYPTGSDVMPMHGEGPDIFRWESTLSASAGQLEFSVDGGQTWSLIAQNTNLNKGFHKWAVPDTFTVAVARMTVAGKSYLTEPFVLSRSPKTRVGFDCTDSTLIFWNRIAGAGTYILYTLEQTGIRPLTVTADTSVVLRKAAYPGLLYAVAPQTVSGRPGGRSPTLDYTLQGADCYITDFVGYGREGGVELNLGLGTVYAIRKIDFERQEAAGFVPVHSLSPVSVSASLRGGSVKHLDETARDGLNIYRARIYFVDGQQLLTAPDSVYFLRDSPYRVFPNPVSARQTLHVYTRSLAAGFPRVTLFLTDGRLRFSQALFTEQTELELPILPPGMYIYVLSNEREQQRGKLVIR